RTDGDDPRSNLDAKRAQQSLGDGPRGNARGRLARRGALEHVAQVVPAVLHPPREIRVPGTRRVHAPPGHLGRIERPWVHRPAPVLVIAVLDADGDGRAERLAAADATGDLRLVVLD